MKETEAQEIMNKIREELGLGKCGWEENTQDPIITSETLKTYFPI